MSPSSPAGSSSSSLPFSNTLLALPDGIIPPGADRSSYTISSIGGYPTFPTGTDQSFNCGVCHRPIPLLAQVYCPPEDGENDRTVYVFGCSSSKCQRREGSIRAFRASKRNEEYVRDVEEKRRIREDEERKERERARVNPFTVSSQQPNGSLFGGPSLFGSNPPSEAVAEPKTSPQPPDITTLSIASSSTSLTSPHPAYMPPQYLTTIEEYLPPPADVEMDSDEEETEEDKAGWRDERWEGVISKNVDVVFDRFVRRIDSAEGGDKQVLRYELGGVPIPYSQNSPLTKKLFPTLPPTKPDDEEPPYHEHYNSSSIPPCPRCKGKRVFELQLVPSLITLLAPESLSTTGEASNEAKSKAQTEEERKKQLAAIAAGLEGSEGMEWGTVMVFGCEKDCVGFGEEWVGVEWETQLSS